MRKRLLCTVIVPLLLLAVGTAQAQGLRGVAITEIPRPDYDALGIRAGAFMVKPELRVGLEFNDNIYATRHNKESDFITTIAPTFSINSMWSRHALGLSAGVKGGVYASNSDENFLDAHLIADGRVDVKRDSRFETRLGIQRLHEPRGEHNVPISHKEPTLFNRAMAEALYHHGFNRMTLRAGAGAVNYDFQSVELRDGTTASLALRDRNDYNVNARLAYELLPNVQPFITARHEWQRYDLSAARRDSDGFRVGVGTGFDLGGVTTGEVFGGFMRQDYMAPEREDISGLWYGLTLLTNVTPITSIQAQVERSVRETTLQGASGIDAVDTGLRLDHELLRNLLVGAFFDYSHEKFEGRAITDKTYRFGPRATYLWNRNLSAELGYARTTKNSNAVDREYTENRLTFALTGKF